MKLFGLILGASAALFAAGPQAVLKGRVTDASGAPLPGAVVVLREPDGLAQRQVTDALGCYKFDGLSPATYSIRIAEPGFRTYESAGIQVKGTTVLNRQLAPPSPARTIAAGAWDKPAPDLRGMLRNTKWSHVKLVPEYNYAAPSEPVAKVRNAFRYDAGDVAMAAYKESPQLTPVFAAGNPELRATIRYKFTF